MSSHKGTFMAYIYIHKMIVADLRGKRFRRPSKSNQANGSYIAFYINHSNFESREQTNSHKESIDAEA
jgi:hypothetical protein